MGTILSFCRCPFCSVMAASSSSLEVTGRVSRAGSFTTGPDGEIGGTGTDPALQLFMYAKRGLTEDVAGITAAEGLDAATLADSLGNTCLHYAAAAGHDETIEWLLAAGSDPNAQNARGDTPLHKAAWKGHASAAALLLAAGGDRYLLNQDEESPVRLSAGNAAADVLEEQLVLEEDDDDDDDEEGYSDSD